MPSIPKSSRRPWKPKPEPFVPQSGRKMVNPFYHSTAWRKFREEHKQEAIAQTRFLLHKIIESGKPIPAAFNDLQPLCAECLKGNLFFDKKYTIATVLDHIKPINRTDPHNTMRGRFGEPLSKKNTQWLCESHHAKKSGSETKFHKKQNP